MATLTGTTIASTYDSLLHVEDNTAGLVATSTDSRVIQDGVGANSALALATDSVRITSTNKLYFNDVGGEYISGDGTDLTITSGNDIVFALGATGSVYSSGDGGTSNTIYGKNAGDALASGGNYNVFLGEEAGTGITLSDDNVAIGYNAFFRATTQADKNVAIGSNAMSGNNLTADADSCVVIGYDALSGTLTTDADGTIAIGHQALKALTDGVGNVAIGYEAGLEINGGHRNTIIGFGAMNDDAGLDNVDNIFIGYDAGGGTWTGTLSSHNVGIGNKVMDAAMNGAVRNTGVGSGALGAIVDGSNNVALGYEAGKVIADGDSNVALGYTALLANVSGTRNVCVGQSAGSAITASENVCIGYQSGDTIQSGGGNTLVGHSADVNATTGEDSTNQIVIGKEATGQADNSVTLGNAAVTAVYMAQDKDAIVYCGGIQFDDAGEQLESYEEGTWTGVIKDESDRAMTMHGSFTSGYYTKVGNLVTLSGRFAADAIGSASGNVRMTGLPFTVANDAQASSAGAVTYGNGFAITAGHSVNVSVTANLTYMSFWVWDATTGTTVMSTAEYSGDGQFMLGLTYRAA